MLIIYIKIIPLPEFEDDPAPPKDAKFDYNSESFRPSSRLKNDFNISIKSELLNKKLEAESTSAGGSRTGSANSSSNMSKKFNLSSGSGAAPKKQLNPKTDSSYEEELYVKGCTAVWSKGHIFLVFLFSYFEEGLVANQSLFILNKCSEINISLI